MALAVAVMLRVGDGTIRRRGLPVSWMRPPDAGDEPLRHRRVPLRTRAWRKGAGHRHQPALHHGVSGPAPQGDAGPRGLSFAEPGPLGRWRLAPGDKHNRRLRRRPAGGDHPRKTINEARRLLEDAGESVDFQVSAQKVRFEFGQASLTSKVIDGAFPDYMRVIPKGNDKQADIDNGVFAAAVDRFLS